MIVYLYFNSYSNGYDLDRAILENGLLYLRKIEEVRILCGTRTAEYQIDIGKVHNIRNDIRDGIELMSQLCSQAKSDVLCEITIKELMQKIVSLDGKFQIIDSANVIQKVHNLQKRDTRFDSLRDHMRKTIAITDKGYSDMKQYLEESRALVNALGRSQNSLNNDIDYINFNLLTQNILAMINRQNFFYNLIIDMLTSNSVKAIMELVENRYLKEEVIKIRRTINKEVCEFPRAQKIIDIVQILEVAKRTTKIVNNNLIISIEYPIVFKREYQLMEAIAIPFMNGDFAYKVSTTDPYYLIHQEIETNTTQGMPLSGEEKRECKRVLNYTLCSPRQIGLMSKLPHDNLIGEFFLPNYKTVLQEM